MLRFLCLALLLAAGCGLKAASALRDSGVRAELSGRLVTTLERQDHYFTSPNERAAFADRLASIAQQTENATTYYRAVSDALATLGEGHTGLVGSAMVPFSSTIPPVALLETDGQIVVAGVAPGVEGGGLLPGDVVLEVDGVPIGRALDRQFQVTSGSTPHGRRARAIANLIAGPTRTPATVRVRGHDGRVRICHPLRFLLDDEGMDRFRFGFLPPSVSAAQISPSAGYVAFPDFHPDRRKELEQALEVFQVLPLLILDLRGNPGGRIRTLQRVAGLFVEGAVPALVLRENGTDEELHTIPGPVAYRGTLKILIDERTGSAGELLAGALRDLGRATLFGRTTAGSARSRLTSMLPGDVLFHYAGKSEFLRRDGKRVEGVGVEPDVLYHPVRADLARGRYGDPFRDPLVRLALGRN
ncbi:MAG: S41 family peptidase [Planctomycetota bacterium]|nr:S41 family peptidase [Planctomycetota bacterium]